ncbi:oligoendopeptidase F [Faecalibacterium sp. CAG:1138]|nr:oligoendopeptidase F [Faecalibacterium sp. CAG:1138]
MAKVLERKKVNDRYKWKVSHIVENDEVWNEKFQAIVAEFQILPTYKGKLGDDATLLEFLKKQDELTIELIKLYLYAHMNSDADTRDDNYQQMQRRIQSALVMISSSLSFVETEICLRSEQQLLALSEKPEFSDYSYMLEKLAKDKKHVLSEEVEKVLADVGSFSGGFREAFSMFDNADVKFKKITIDGVETEMSHGVYGYALQCADQATRQAAFESMFGAYKDHINTIAALYGNHVKKDAFYAKTKKYDSCLSMALEQNDVDPAAYENLIKMVDENCKYMHKYMAFRKKALGVEKLNMWDLHTSIVKDVDIAVPYEKAYKMVKEALKPLGEEYQGLLTEAYENGWIDVCETKGKRSGAYSTSTYGCHPFVLLNYQQTSHDIFTIAHELGHAMHSHYSQENQPFSKSDYVIFVAEIASTVNEVLMLKYLISKTKDVEMKKYLLSYYLDMFRTTLFRQTMFAEFELEAHKLAEADAPITANALSEIYYNLNKKYYGKAVTHNDLIRYEWARIPHFYTSFYVYQYATGITAAISIANNILKNGEKAFKGYKQFLSAGGSMPPIEILKLAGVDLTTEEPFKVAMKEFKDTLNELIKIY